MLRQGNALPVPAAVFTLLAVVASGARADDVTLSPYETNSGGQDTERLSSNARISVLAQWSHMGISGSTNVGEGVQPSGLSAGLRIDLDLDTDLILILEGRSGRAQGEEGNVEVNLKHTTGILGIGYFLARTEKERVPDAFEPETGVPGENLYVHVLEFGAGVQTYKGKLNSLGLPAGEADKTGAVMFVRYRLGAHLGRSWVLSLTGGLERVRRKGFDSIPPGLFRGSTRWETDWSFQIVLGGTL